MWRRKREVSEEEEEMCGRCGARRRKRGVNVLMLCRIPRLGRELKGLKLAWELGSKLEELAIYPNNKVASTPHH